jgi:hypothetical protein
MLKSDAICCIRDDYIVGMCTQPVPPENPRENEEENGERRRTAESIVLIAYHIPSREEIGQISLSTHGTNLRTLRPRLINNACGANNRGGLVALALGSIGIAVAGENVRGMRAPDCVVNDSTKSTKKKKGTRLKRGGSKKDAFARGMSLRG